MPDGLDRASNSRLAIWPMAVQSRTVPEKCATQFGRTRVALTKSVALSHCEFSLSAAPWSSTLSTPSGTELSLTIGQYSEAGPKPSNQDFHGALVPKGADLALKGAAVALALAEERSFMTMWQIAYRRSN